MIRHYYEDNEVKKKGRNFVKTCEKKNIKNEKRKPKPTQGMFLDTYPLRWSLKAPRGQRGDT